MRVRMGSAKAMRRVLFLATTTGYQTRMFGEAAERLGVKLVFATDRCDQLDDPWWDGAIPIRFHQEAPPVETLWRRRRTRRSRRCSRSATGRRVIAAYAAHAAGPAGPPARRRERPRATSG